ncbi:MAG: UDP-N-acetylmuramate--L-alanine ligase [Bacteroidales bacterium]
MDLKNVNRVYFVGIGGIGMSALARYFRHLGKEVAGYDKTPTELTANLQKEGILVHFSDKAADIPHEFTKNKNNTLVVYTPAIPPEHEGFNYLKTNGFNLLKRSEILGLITSDYETIAIAGTHGKTSVSTSVAHILKQSPLDCLAFLGGISKNYGTNLVLPEKPEFHSRLSVAEADEFDRSFLRLSPAIALITSMDADHLDIYGNHASVVESFNLFVKNIKPNGKLIYKKGLPLVSEYLPKSHYTYSLTEEADFYAVNLKMENNGIHVFDLMSPFGRIENLRSGVPGKTNAENAVAAASVALLAGLEADIIRKNLAGFIGVKRRFDFVINNERMVYVDDYAHHPEELKAFIGSMKEIFSTKKITGIFQPHLYSRTRDFSTGFAESLDLLDDLILLEIYPAREKPIKGIDSGIIFDKMRLQSKIRCSVEELTGILKEKKPEVLLTMGAGNIGDKIEEIKAIYLK